MAIISPYQTYQQNSVMTASPQELTLMLYTGSMKFMRLAKKAIADKKFEEKNINLIKVQNIIQELQVTLDPNIDLSQNLGQLYDYMYTRLVEANTKNDADILTEVEELMRELRDTWKQIIETSRV
ncbi:flagellar export chaperone FliS [Planococcus lenghuensis]|uniref:Flagellar export chaperone FliS n=1 Tax=Planococcus lenghuensis TaxID=2213202 RepID=A0A1Q2L279_9BACL|nr:flagellar export chaperone FliS [Planococcus lenghuensis]AQQ54147.1 flagellar export chaperone FliS [Planococcus lenghuensis]